MKYSTPDLLLAASWAVPRRLHLLATKATPRTRRRIMLTSDRSIRELCTSARQDGLRECSGKSIGGISAKVGLLQLDLGRSPGMYSRRNIC